eukprot:m.221234 g.221234  ORF g.221234 m.221234 type:complete len:569 (+) comp39956_c1_seq10:140-1846(+)
MGEAIIGIMLDVSGSMKETFNLDRSTDTDVEKSHTILTSIMNIVKREVVQHNCKESVFTCAFGLCQRPETWQSHEICDLMPLLEYFSKTRTENVYEKLFQLACSHGASHINRWIRSTLSEFQAVVLLDCLRSNSSLARELVALIPSGEETTSAYLAAKGVDKAPGISLIVGLCFLGLSLMSPFFLCAGSPFLVAGIAIKPDCGTSRLEAEARNSKAYKRACEIINQHIKLRPRSVQQVSKTLDVLLNSTEAPSAESSLHHKIRELLDPIKPFIFGKTPMCKALKDAWNIFLMKKNASRKVLFILSDGCSTDGDPRPMAEELHSLGVTIITCFLTSHAVENPKRLLYEADDSWAHKDGRRVLFEMSSPMKNTHTPITYLVDADWELPGEGSSHLFIEANSVDVVNEFCEIVVSQMTRPCDALLHILEKIDLATYVNQQNAQFEPKQQHKATCYANAIAAVFHLTLNQIVGRRCPTFETIRKGIIEESGSHGADVEQVLEQFCPQYQLRYRKVDEEGARRAINERRVLVAEFCLDDDQWEQFHKFYEDHSGGILGRHNLNSEFNHRYLLG